MGGELAGLYEWHMSEIPLQIDSLPDDCDYGAFEVVIASVAPDDVEKCLGHRWRANFTHMYNRPVQ